MFEQSLSVIKSGMVSAVGLNAPATCAAVRCGIANFQETRFLDSDGEWIIGSSVPLEKPWRGKLKLLHLVAPAIRESLSDLVDHKQGNIPLLLCLAGKDRPGRLEGLDESYIKAIQELLGFSFHSESKVFINDRVGGAEALTHAYTLIVRQHHPYCIVAGVDSFLVGKTLTAYEEKDRLLTSENSNGFIPGEGAAAILVGANRIGQEWCLKITGVGFGKETAIIDSDEPLLANGMVQAFNNVFSTTDLFMKDMNYRISDANGEQYKFKEGDLAVNRTLRDHKGEIDIWNPADCIGEVGAAFLPFVIGIADTASIRGYSKGNNALCHFSNDNGDRAAVILTKFTSGVV